MYTNSEYWAGFKIRSWAKCVNVRTFIKHKTHMGEVYEEKIFTNNKELSIKIMV